MKWPANLIILSLLISMAILSNAATGLIDPTRPANYVEEAVESFAQENKGANKGQDSGKENQTKSEFIPDYRLNAIKIGRTSRIAVINGETVSPGQKVGTATLIKINPDSVEMNVNGQAITVSLLPGSIKTRASK